MRTRKSTKNTATTQQHIKFVSLKTQNELCDLSAKPLRPLCLVSALTGLLLFAASSTFAQQNNARFSAINPGMHNERLENEAIWLANKKAGTIKCDEEFIDAKITSEDWGMDYDMQGRITGRHLHMELYGETRSGKCGMSHCVFRQKLQGDNTFSPRLKLVELGEFFAMECE